MVKAYATALRLLPHKIWAETTTWPIIPQYSGGASLPPHINLGTNRERRLFLAEALPSSPVAAGHGHEPFSRVHPIA